MISKQTIIMEKIHGIEPAQPTLVYNEKSGKPIEHKIGLTIHQEFSARAMEALITKYGITSLEDYNIIATKAIRMANAMINSLNK